MTDKELDDLFQNTFSDHRMPVPPDMWERVSPQKDKRRRGAFLWWSFLGAAAVLMLTGTAIWLYHPEPEKTVISAAATHVKETKVPAKKEKALADKTALANGKTGTPASASETGKAFDSYHDAATDNKAPNEVWGSRIDQNNRRNHLSMISNNQSPELSNKAAGNNNNSAGNSELTKSRNETAGTANRNNNTGQSTLLNTDEANTSSGLPFAPVQKTDRAVTAASAPIKQEAKAANMKVKKIHGEKAPGLEIMIAGYGNDRTVYASKEENPLVAFGPVSRKDKVLMHSISINARIDKPLTPHISLKTGLQFLHTRQRISYGYETVNQTPSISSFGNDTLISARLQSKQSTLTAFYNSFSVPVLVSYHTNGTGLDFGATAGVVVNVLSRYRGEVPDAGGYQPVAAKSVFRMRTGASLYAGITASRQVGGFRLFAEPHIQYTLSSITKSPAPFRQKITSYGIGIGIRKTIGK